MAVSCRPEALEALLRDELDASSAEAVHAHLRGCRSCGLELAWLRAEATLLAQRARRQELAPALRQELEHSRRAPARRRVRPLLAAGLAVAACVLLIVPLSRSVAPVQAPAPEGGALASVDWAAPATEQRFGACLIATPNVGWTCGGAAWVAAR